MKRSAALAISALWVAAGILVFVGAASSASSPEKFDSAMAPLLASYLKIQTALASDSTVGVPQAARAIAAASTKEDMQGVPEESAPHYEEMLAAIAKASEALAAAATLEEARARFKDLSRPMTMWGMMSKPAGVNVMYCSMAKAKWLQDEGPVRNPYYGASMLSCGEVVHGEEHPKP
jgi:hypothetical protein